MQVEEVKQILSKYQDTDRPDENDIEDATIELLSHKLEEYHYQVTYDNGKVDIVSIDINGEVVFLNPYIHKSNEYRDGWYFFPCISFPVKVKKGNIPMTPYIHFQTYDECKQWINKYHSDTSPIRDDIGGNYGC